MKENNNLINFHNPDVNLPYVDYLLDKFRDGDEILIKSFGRHMHWGYWNEPGQALLSAEDYALAAETLSKLISKAGNVQQQQTILDVGCGFGGTIAYLNENFQDMKLVGINLDGRQLDRACPKDGHAIRPKSHRIQAKQCLRLAFSGSIF